MFDGKAFGEQMVQVVRGYVDEATAPLLRRIEAQDAEIAALKAVPAPERGEPGEPGRDGADADMEELKAHLNGLVAALPRPVAGKDGADADMDVLKAHLADLVAALPAPPAGADGVGLAGAVIDRAGELNITLTSGEVRNLGPVVGKDGRDGNPGKDGTDGEHGEAWDKMGVERVGPRTVRLSFGRGEQASVHELQFPVPIYRGVFVLGDAYEAGDLVTWAGSLWHCNDPSEEKPGDGSKAWTLAAKRGRDGKDFAGPQQTRYGPVKVS